MIRKRDFLGLAAGAAFAGPAAGQTLKAPVRVYAAAAMQDALNVVGQAYAKLMGQWVQFTFGEPFTLARRLERGAVADIFISTDRALITELEQRRIVDGGTQKAVFASRLALIAPKASTVSLNIAPGFPLAQALGGGKLAMADARTPTGISGKAALQKLGVWDQVEAQVERGEFLRGPLPLVAKGEAPLGVALFTDASDPRVRLVGVFPDDIYPAIIFRAAMTRSAQEGTEVFLKYLREPEARVVFDRYGFLVVKG
jgi:molybdate transport system substrate-binding protein